MEEVFVEILGVRINEPMTIVTDFIVALVGFWAFNKLKPPNCSNNSILFWFKLYFVTIAAGTFLGGVLGHGLSHYLSPLWRLPGWILGAVAVSCIELASIEITKDKTTNRNTFLFKIFIFLKFAILMFFTFRIQNFMYVIIHTAVGFLLFVMPVHLLLYRKDKNETSRYIVIAILTALLSAIVFVLKIKISKWFNHSDLGHIVLAFVLYYFYKAARAACCVKQASS